MSAPRRHFLHSAPRLHYLEWNPHGHGTIVLLHGNSANAWWWEWVAHELPFRILAIDQRGHGDSEWVRPPAYRPEDYAADIARFIREVLGHEKPIVAGHSMGGLSTLAFARGYPELARAAIAIDVPVTSSRKRDVYLSRLKSLPTVIYPDPETAKARFRLMPDEGGIPRERVHAIAEKSLMAAEQGGWTMKFDRDSFFGGDGLHVMDAIRSLSIATLLVRAEHSRIMTQEGAEAAVASNQHARLIVIPHAHHHVLLEKPAELAKAIIHFVESVE